MEEVEKDVKQCLEVDLRRTKRSKGKTGRKGRVKIMTCAEGESNLRFRHI
jgi:hypothetical protein